MNDSVGMARDHKRRVREVDALGVPKVIESKVREAPVEDRNVSNQLQ